MQHVHAYDIHPSQHGFADDSEEGDFFYNEEEVLNGVGAADRAALLDRYDAMLGDSEQPELEEVQLNAVALDSDECSAIAPEDQPQLLQTLPKSLFTHCSVPLLLCSDSVTLAALGCSILLVLIV